LRACSLPACAWPIPSESLVGRSPSGSMAASRLSLASHRLVAVLIPTSRAMACRVLAEQPPDR
jgi:hypothetical protein